MSIVGKQLIAAYVAAGSTTEFLQAGLREDMFVASELEQYNFVSAFAKQHAKLPEPETIYENLGEKVVLVKEPPSYYLELLRTRFVQRELLDTLKKAQTLVHGNVKEVAQALELVTERAMMLTTRQYGTQVVDFRYSKDAVIAEVVANTNKLSPRGLYYGWPTLDEMTGGVGKGDLISFVGRPAAGKTFQMLYGALHGWNRAGELYVKTGEVPEFGQSRMFVSMEMGATPILARLAALQTHSDMGKMKKGFGSKGFNQLKAGLTEITGFGEPFWVVDGNLASTVEDLWMLARQLKPDAMFIDGGYLVQHPTERDRFRRVAENADLMKRELCPICPTTVSWQFAKSASKKKKGEKVTGDDVGYSDAIFQVSSLLLGLFQDESVETIKQRRVEILKGRNGETGVFRTNWNFTTMDFDEVKEENVADLVVV